MDIITPIALGLLIGISINIYESIGIIISNINPFGSTAK